MVKFSVFTIMLNVEKKKKISKLEISELLI